jgi:hypothetical protein
MSLPRPTYRIALRRMPSPERQTMTTTDETQDRGPTRPKNPSITIETFETREDMEAAARLRSDLDRWNGIEEADASCYARQRP